jgi:hypothetical protein
VKNGIRTWLKISGTSTRMFLSISLGSRRSRKRYGLWRYARKRRWPTAASLAVENPVLDVVHQGQIGVLATWTAAARSPAHTTS